ncbi:MAG: hypothetical protein H6625_07300 [Bdellovibrionaceae bacterium]|nr:hypothetical protein [Pseudobdellovibrionaceae bacterium]
MPAVKINKQKLKKKLNKALRKIVYVPCEDKLTFAGGLPVLVELFSSCGLEDELEKCLPERLHARSIGSLKLAYTIMFSVNRLYSPHFQI